MAETIICTPDELGQVLLENQNQHVEGQRRMLTRGLGYIKKHMRQEAPRYRGDFAESIEEYVGEPGPTWSRGGGGGNTSGSVEATMNTWKPGQEVGIATDAPYARKLIFHAGENKGVVSRRNRRGRRVRTSVRRTYTKKVGAGWVDKIVDAANRQMMESE